MLLERPRGSTYETIETLHQTDEGVLVAARADGEDLLVFVPRTLDVGRLERERLEFLAGPAIPSPRVFSADGTEALVYVGAAGGRPLAGGKVSLPDSVWRRALVRMLSGLSQAHGRGFVHGRISRRHLLADPSGEFWIQGWAGARKAVGRGPFHAGIDDVAADVRDLGVALVLHLGDAPDDEPEAPPPTDGPAVLREVDPAVVKRSHARVALFDRELARVLVRLVATDPREAYESATEILSDLGEADESLPDPWFDLPYVGRRRIVRHISAQVERCGTRNAEFASVQVVGPPGSGRTRLLHEVARIARDRHHIVMTANGGAPQQPWGAIGSIARQMLARLPAGHPMRVERGVRILVGEAPSPIGGNAELAGGDGASAALAELLRCVFATERGVILLDDEDGLAGHAGHAWRLLERHLSAITGPSSPRVLLVSASTRAAPDEMPTARERIVIGEMSPRHLTQMLAPRVTERGKAPILAQELVAAVGARPGDVVDHLREMLDRRAVALVGNRLHVEDPVEAVRAAAASRLRRTLESVGRDAAALAETLAVAGRLRLSRDTLADVAELPGHRLQAAADAALRSSLLTRDGATWRLRTESQRARLVAGLAEDRRRGLHREILIRLLDHPAPDWPAIAHHGRASADPRAAEWTRHALGVLRACGRFDEAADHFDEARSLLDPAALDVDLRLVQVDTLLHAGRLDDATRCAAEIAADPVATDLQRGHALLALARLHRYDQAWSKVLAIELPATCGDPVVLARIRLLRAIAHVFRGRPDLADREERLALAEVGDTPGEREVVEYARAELRAAREALALNANALAATCLWRLRNPVARGQPLEHLLDLVRLASARRLDERYAEAEAILRYVLRSTQSRLGDNPLVYACALQGLSFVASARDNPRRTVTLLEAATAHAARTGATCFALGKRIELAMAHLRSGADAKGSQMFVRQLGSAVHSIPDDVVTYALRALSACFLHNGDQRALEELRSRIERAPSYAIARWVLDENTHTSAFSLEDLSPLGVDPATASAQDILNYVDARRAAYRAAYSLDPTACDDALPSLASVWGMIACLFRRGIDHQPTWPDEWQPVRIAAQIQEARAYEHHELDMMYSLLLLPDGCIPRDEWWRLAGLASHSTRDVPFAVCWKRAAVAAKYCLRSGRVRDAMNLVGAAHSFLRALDDPTSGSARPAVVKWGAHAMNLTGVRVTRSTSRPPSVVRTVPTCSNIDLTAWKGWERAITECLRSESAYVSCGLTRELEVFADLVQSALGASWIRDPEALQTPSRNRLLVMTPEDWAPHQVRKWLAGRRRASALHVGVLIASTLPPHALRACSREHSAVMSAGEGTCIALRSPVEVVSARVDLMRWALNRIDPASRAVVDDVASEEFLGYSWPGGIAEIEGVAREIRLRTNGPVGRGVLEEIGWSHRRAGAGDAFSTIPNAAVILTELRRRGALSCRELSTHIRRPMRTVVRGLSALSELGLVERSGAGRASVYRAAGACRQPTPQGETA